MFSTNLDNAVKNIQLDELEIAKYVEEVEKIGSRDELLKSIRMRLVDASYIKERSIYCGLIREFNDKESLPLLWRLIAQDETKGRRGSLVFAMENMNPVDYLEKLVDLAINDNNEVMFNSLDVIDNIEGYIDGDTLEKCITKLQTALKNTMPEWRKEALTLLLEEFQED